MNGWTSARHGLMTMRYSVFALGLALTASALTRAAMLPVIVALLAIVALGLGSLWFSLGLPQSPARSWATRSLWVGAASTALRAWVLFGTERHSGGAAELGVLADLIGIGSVLLHFAAWKSAAEARSSEVAASRINLARVVVVAFLLLNAGFIYQARTHFVTRGLELLQGGLAVFTLVLWFRALLALEHALEERTVSWQRDEATG
ncbi:MAG: hypothetical protein IPJ65_13035 [Archangiaceae bacterium]|nr:hypothetical protein [Archangiaceae bacterium]